MIVIPFKPWHLKCINFPAEHCLPISWLHDTEYIGHLAKHESWSGIRGGEVVACAGFLPSTAGGHSVWAIIDATIGASGMIRVSKAVLSGLANRPGRFEALVAQEFEAGKRWAQLMGFTNEGDAGERSPGGAEYDLWTRFNQ